MSKYTHIQESAYEANKRLPKLGLVLFTFGNVSAADRDLGVFAIKPSGVPYEDLTPESFDKVLDAISRGETPKPGPQNGRQFSAPLGGETTLKSLAGKPHA